MNTIILSTGVLLIGIAIGYFIKDDQKKSLSSENYDLKKQNHKLVKTNNKLVDHNSELAEGLGLKNRLSKIPHL